MAKINNKTKNSQSLVKLVKRLKNLKDFKPNLPKSKIEDIIADPEAWAEEYAQFVLETEGWRILEAKKFGEKFAESLLEEKDG